MSDQLTFGMIGGTIVLLSRPAQLKPSNHLHTNTRHSCRIGQCATIIRLVQRQRCLHVKVRDNSVINVGMLINSRLGIATSI